MKDQHLDFCISLLLQKGVSGPGLVFATTVVPLDAALSYDAGMLRPITLEGGLSLGDRCCLALAKREDRPALTAERRWPLFAEAAGVDVELIR